jgi:hypothetical protein
VHFNSFCVGPLKAALILLPHPRGLSDLGSHDDSML